MFFFDVNKKYWVGLRLNAKIITFPLMAFKKACLLLLNESIKGKISAKYQEGKKSFKGLKNPLTDFYLR